MKTVIANTCLACVLMLAVSSLASASNRPPNVLFIIVDDSEFIEDGGGDPRPAARYGQPRGDGG